VEILTFFITFGILFLGELGDKTQLIVFNLALEYDNAWKVGLGVTLGFAAVVTLGVFFGVIITNFIPLSIIAFFSGIIFIIIGLLEARNLKDLIETRKKSSIEEEKNNNRNEIKSKINNNGSVKFSKMRKNPYLAGFIFIFLMELGDKTQILTITLSSMYPHPLEVWLGSFFALISLAWMGVFFGALIARKIPKFHLKLISVFIFIIIGIIIIIASII